MPGFITARLRNASPVQYFLAACLFLNFPPVHAQNFTSFTTWQIPVSGSGPRDVAPVGAAATYFTELNSSKIGYLDMNANLLTEWTLPSGAYPRGLSAEGQKVAFAEGNSYAGGLTGLEKIAVLDSASGILTEWSIPRITQSIPEPLQVSMLGQFVFFTDSSQGAIGMLDTSTDVMTQWLLPGAPVRRAPDGIAATLNQSQIEVWIADEQAQKISLLIPAANTFAEWSVPNLNSSQTLDHLQVANGVVAFQDSTLNLIGTLIPSVNAIREWRIPEASAGPLYVAWVSPGVVAFSEYSTGRIGVVNLAAAPAVQAGIAPRRAGAPPVVQAVAPEISVLVPALMAISPEITGASRIVRGAFAEYPIPTASSEPAGVAASNGGVVFAEFSDAGNRIGRLR